MMRNLLLLQLGFNVLMLLALLVLARVLLRSEPARHELKPEAVPPPPRAKRSLFRSRRSSEVASAPVLPLNDLVQRAESEELAAEAALRARLARYSGRAANA